MVLETPNSFDSTMSHWIKLAFNLQGCFFFGCFVLLRYCGLKSVIFRVFTSFKLFEMLERLLENVIDQRTRVRLKQLHFQRKWSLYESKAEKIKIRINKSFFCVSLSLLRGVLFVCACVLELQPLTQLQVAQRHAMNMLTTFIFETQSRCYYTRCIYSQS